jgi:hypothetical protein
VTLHLALLEPAGQPVAISLARAGQNLAGPGAASPLSGWYSPTYGLKLPALSLTLTIQTRPPVQLVSQFLFEPRSLA